MCESVGQRVGPVTDVADRRCPAGLERKRSPLRFFVNGGSGVGVREWAEVPFRDTWGDGAGEDSERKCVCGVRGRCDAVVVTQQAWP